MNQKSSLELHLVLWQAFSLITAEKGKDAACKMHPLVALSHSKMVGGARYASSLAN